MGYGDYRNKVLKATDSEFDFLGLQGLYFYVFLGGCGAVFLLLLALTTLGAHWTAIILVLTPVLAASYFIPRHLSKKYGKGGYSAIAESTTPTDIQIRADGDCYEKLS